MMAFVTSVPTSCIRVTSGLVSLTWPLCIQWDRTMRLHHLLFRTWKFSPLSTVITSSASTSATPSPYLNPFGGCYTLKRPSDSNSGHPPRTPFDTFHLSIPRNDHSEGMRDFDRLCHVRGGLKHDVGDKVNILGEGECQDAFA